MCTFATSLADFAELADSFTLLSLYKRRQSLMKAFLLCMCVLQFVDCLPRRGSYWDRRYEESIRTRSWPTHMWLSLKQSNCENSVFHFLHPSTPTLDLCTAVYKTRLCTFATCSADFAGLANSSALSLLSLYRRMRSLMKAFLLCLFVLQLVNCVPRRYRYWSRWYAGQPTRIGSADFLSVFF